MTRLGHSSLSPVTSFDLEVAFMVRERSAYPLRVYEGGSNQVLDDHDVQLKRRSRGRVAKGKPWQANDSSNRTRDASTFQSTALSSKISGCVRLQTMSTRNAPNQEFHQIISFLGVR